MSIIGNLLKKKLETKKYGYRPFDVFDTENYLVKDYIEIARSAYSPEHLKGNRSLILYIATVASNQTPTVGPSLTGKVRQVYSRFGDLDEKVDRKIYVMDFLNALSVMSTSELDKWLNQVVFPEGFMDS